MKRFTSAILAFLLLPFTAVQFLNCNRVAAQQVQQAQSSPRRQPPPNLLLQHSPGADTAQASAKPLASAEFSNSDSVEAAAARPSVVRIPDRTPIEVEAPYMYRSMDFKPND